MNLRTFAFATSIACATVATAVADQVNITSVSSRFGSAAGLSDLYFGAVNARDSFGGALPATVRPNGSTTWDFEFPSQVTAVAGPLSNPISGAAVESWMQSNAVGEWQVSFGGAAFNTFDTTPYYTQIAQREYIELTADSVALFESIRSQGLTGTFTFDLTAPHYSKGQGIAYIGGSAFGGVSSLDGSTFSMTISQALASDALLVLQFTTGNFVSDFGNGNSAYFTQISESVYGFTVPAPGAIALLGLAGLAGRRRR